MLLRYPALQEVTRSHIGIPASARAKVAAFIQADLVPTEGMSQTNLYKRTEICFKYCQQSTGDRFFREYKRENKMTMRGDDHKIPLSGMNYLHLLGELGHKYLSANYIAKSSQKENAQFTLIIKEVSNTV